MNHQPKLLAKKWHRSLIAIVLAAGLLMLPVWMAGRANAIDLTRKCTLTVDATGSFEDAANANVVIDLYKVADAVEVPSYDTYAYSPVAPYTTLQTADGVTLEDTDQLTNADYQELAQQAAQLTLNSGMSVAKAVNGGEAGTSLGDLDAGLYLLIARGADIEDYVTTVTDEAGDTQIATIAHSSEYVYTYAPELITLPSKAADENGVVNTSNPGEWIYDLTVTLKPEQSVRFGDLEIVKTLDTYEGDSTATFVFQIEATVNGTVVYSNVAGLNFTSAGTERILLADQIPVGATVTVTEVYSGSKYALTSEESQTVTIVAPDDGTASVSFRNTYSGENRGGSGIINHFTNDGDGFEVENRFDNRVQ
jgi:hypothetical protein